MGTLCTVAVTAGPFDATPRQPRPRGRARRGRRLRAGALALRPGSDLCRLNAAAGEWVRGRRAPRAPHCAWRSARATRPAEGSTRRSCRRSSRPATTAPSSSSTTRPARTRAGWRAGAAIELDRRPGVPGSRKARPSTSAASARASPRPVRSRRCERPGRCFRGGLVDLGGDIAVLGLDPRRRPLAAGDRRSAHAGLDARHARARGRRSGNVRTRQPPLRPERHAPPSDRPGDRRPRRTAGPLAVTVVAPSRTRPRRTPPRSPSPTWARPTRTSTARPHLAALLVPGRGRAGRARPPCRSRSGQCYLEVGA